MIKDNGFLMVRKHGKDIWTSLGGHVEEGETEEAALLREIKEELDCEGVIERKLGDYRAKAIFDDDVEVLLSTYVVTLHGAPVISDPELAEFRYLPHNYQAQDYKLPDSITDHVIPACIEASLLDWRA